LISSDSNIWNLLEDKRKQKLKPTQNDKSDEISFSTFVDERSNQQHKYYIFRSFSGTTNESIREIFLRYSRI
jgi:hypothetical protein